MTAASRTQILNSAQIERKLQRIAREILERHWDADKVWLVGVKGRGEAMNRRLAHILEDIAPMDIATGCIALDKDAPLEHDIRFEGLEPSTLRDEPVVLVDDVLNSGRTLMHAAKALLDHSPKQLSTAVLIDRIHRSFPIRADFCGLSLSTNLKEHIEVVLGEQDGAFLT